MVKVPSAPSDEGEGENDDPLPTSSDEKDEGTLRHPVLIPRERDHHTCVVMLNANLSLAEVHPQREGARSQVLMWPFMSSRGSMKQSLRRYSFTRSGTQHSPIVLVLMSASINRADMQGGASAPIIIPPMP